MAELCREFAISRKTGYKIFDRYQECGVQGLTDRSRRPYRYAHQLSFQVENYILNVKREHTTWGARKIRERLIRRFSGIMKCPAEVYQPSTGLDPNKTGAPGETRTPDPLLRRQTLYPTELRAHRAVLLILKHFSIPQLSVSS